MLRRSIFARARLSDQELETLVEIGEEEGALHEAEGEMIQEIIKLGDKTAKDCMTPRVDTFALPDDLTNEEAIARLKQKRHRRVPVYADTPDNILGILDVKMFLFDPSDHYTERLIAPSFVPETMRALELLRQFLSHAQGLAIVVDEFGGTEGIITLSDIVEEILSDAVPRGDVDLYIEPLDDGKFLVSGNARLDDLREHLGFEIEADGIDTIGGLSFQPAWIFAAAGHAHGNTANGDHGATHGTQTNRGAAPGKNKLCVARPNIVGRGGTEIMTPWLAILGCWAISFLFAGIEAGVLSVDPVRLRNQVKQRKRRAQRLDRLLKSPERLLVTVLLVTNMADILGLLLLTRQMVVSFGYKGFFFALLIALPVYLFGPGCLSEVSVPKISAPRPGQAGHSSRDCFTDSLAGA